MAGITHESGSCLFAHSYDTVANSKSPRSHAAGLFVEGALIGDIFMMAQPEQGSSYASLREMLVSCARFCPAQAISHGDSTTEGPTVSNQHGVRKWYINPEKCFSYWGEKQVSCSRCIRSCAFNKPPGVLHDLTRAIIRRTALFNRFIVRIDKLLGYAKPYRAQRYWEGRPIRKSS